jgi:hypothetical protein
LIYDLRSRNCVSKNRDVFGGEKGAISAFTLGRDAYSLTIGSLGGYLSTFDIRYGLNTAVFRHHLNQPVLALASFNNTASGIF